jgi:hypothetical protein
MRWPVAILMFLAGAAIVPAAASATTASVSGGVILVEDTEGIDDEIDISSAGSNEFGPTIRIDGAEPGAGCTPDAQGDAFCPDGTGADGTGTPSSIRLALGDGDDEVVLRRNINTGLDDVDVTFDTGAGEDTVELRARGRFLILTGPEDDTVTFTSGGSGTQEAAGVDTGGGNDTVELVGNAQVGDTVDGGPGDADHVSYDGRPVTPNLRIRSNPDRPSGRVGTTANRLGENDRLANFEVLEGHSGRSTITGGPGDDTLIGNGGRDGLRGGDGDDRLDTNDGVVDLVAVCGLDDDDVAIIDSVDPNPNAVPVLGLSRNCETVMQQPRGQRPLAFLSQVRERDDLVSVRLRCVRRNGCRGSLVVADRRRRRLSERETFDLGNGDSQTYRLSLNVGSLPRGAQVLARGRDGRGRKLESSVVI